MDTIQINSTPQFKLSPYLFMQFAEPLGTADSSIDAAWDFLHERWQPKALGILKRLAPPMIRWGGCFSSYYHWKDAVGPRRKRVPMHNLCWDGIYLNQVGTCELAELAGMLGSELLFCVNFESDGRAKWAHPRPDLDLKGSAEEAAEWVRYCNDPDDPLRKSHGYAAPFGIRYWQIGNETGYDPDGFNAEENAETAKRFVKTLRSVDSGLKLIVWGDGPNEEWQEHYRSGKPSLWAKDVCEAVGDATEMVAFHNHFGAGPEYAALHGTEYRRDPDATWERLMASTGDFEDRILYMRNAVESYGRKLAMTESHLVPAGRHRGDILSSWGAGAAYAKCANILERHGNIIEIATLADFMGNRWQNNAVMLPTPMWTAIPPYFLPVGSIMALYSHHIGKEALDVKSCSSIDAAGSRTGSRCYLHLVNLERTAAQSLRFEIDGVETVPAAIHEIAANATAEITEMTPEIFAPKMVKPSGSRYVLPAAGVAVIEFRIPGGLRHDIQEKNGCHRSL